jgi:hypothetical protein
LRRYDPVLRRELHGSLKRLQDDEEVVLLQPNAMLVLVSYNGDGKGYLWRLTLEMNAVALRLFMKPDISL